MNLYKEWYHDRKIKIENIQNRINIKEKDKKPLIDRFNNAPQNTKEIDDWLYEDLNGNGNGTGVNQTLEVYSYLIRNKSLDITNKTAKRLDWNSESPESKVTTSDMITLFGHQIRYNN